GPPGRARVAGPPPPDGHAGPTRQARRRCEAMSAVPKPRRATLAEVMAYPEGTNVELIDGMLHVMARPAPRHANAGTILVTELGGPFHLGRGGPGGWWILMEPELHFPDPNVVGETEVLIPDLAGWRRERMLELPETAYFTLAPDWICEVLSK